MIVFALVYTGLLVGVTYLIVSWTRGYSLVCFVCIAGLGAGMACFSFFLLLNSFLVLLAVGACAICQATPRTLLKASLLASGLAYLALFILTLFFDGRDYSDLRAEYLYESVADRLAYEPPRRADNVAGRPQMSLASGAAERLTELEQGLGKRTKPYRTDHLRVIHELHRGVVERFIDSPGFGRFRRFGPSQLTLRLDEREPVPQPAGDYFKKFTAGTQQEPELTGPTGQPPEPPEERVVWLMHWNSLLDFVNPEGFGYVRDRDHVAGFQSHRFSDVPEGPAATWRVETVELVSLLKHPEPGVYLSPNLPRMDELRKARTRPLDAFESTALGELRKGEDLKVSVVGDRLRILGSLRAGKQCLSCHEAERGDLLGAFTYRLRREPSSR